MVYFTIKNKDKDYVLAITNFLKSFYVNNDIIYNYSDLNITQSGEWYISIERSGDINAYNI